MRVAVVGRAGARACHYRLRILASIVPSLFSRGERKGPGIHCVRMRYNDSYVYIVSEESALALHVN